MLKAHKACKFYASVNAVMAHSKFVNEDVKLRLFKSFALLILTLILTLILNVLFLSGTQLSKLNSGWNNVYREILVLSLGSQ